MARRRKFGVSFSWKRALGISAAKARLSRKIGIPLSRSGRQQKIGRLLGCCVLFACMVLGVTAAVVWAALAANAALLHNVGGHGQVKIFFDDMRYTSKAQ